MNIPRKPKVHTRPFLLAVGFAFVSVLVIASSIRPAFALDDLIAHWQYDEGTGTTINDSSGNGHNGTLHGGAAYSSSAAPTNFTNPYSLDFNGTNGYIAVPDDPALRLTDFTLTAWVKVHDYSTFQIIVSKANATANQPNYECGINPSGKFYIWNSNDAVFGSTTLATDQWYYLTCIADGGQAKVYVDGVEDGSGSFGNPNLNWDSNSLYIGADHPGQPGDNQFFNGSIDDFRLYGRGLTPTEVTSLADGDPGPGVINDNGLGSGVEDASPNSGDANDDSVQDSQQSNVASFVNSVTSGYVSLAADNTCELSGLSVKSTSGLGTDDTDYSYPLGLLDFTANCGTPGFTATITQYYYNPPDKTFVLRKFVNGSYQMVSGATIQQTTIGGLPVLKVSYQVTDGGPLDDDGVANGVIVDPAGPAFSTATTTTSSGTSTGGTLANTGVALLASTGVALVLTSLAIGVQYYRTAPGNMRAGDTPRRPGSHA